ncbi:hypothetical protein QUF80_06815 [Desulfococcaceae bacterium HSG8]|nr:hypothetical protein [Desulfococcaceae bacterium HSG8]
MKRFRADCQTSEVLMIIGPAKFSETSEVLAEEVPGRLPELRGFDDNLACEVF